ncbi:MAG: hypothetical protein A3H64_00220 [Candidatus Ryanbacteria bacterium RIFCSPLOWO2_02_FULL_45_11c]|uniref:Uncharacterized protein n=1 Tax=Candidatus Ryanbacteria bacterium RIFCSPLOWO2_02_FULL_45_11c TaxID=1802128 RepID=A0A1G2GZR0_9BACT|nr:MAG: hypothetical protein A3H64_00220 [Candidatus Ryanbacteria bacterium RIFCSPLOWO2_02_FULL_45_11c]
MLSIESLAAIAFRVTHVRIVATSTESEFAEQVGVNPPGAGQEASHVPTLHVSLHLSSLPLSKQVFFGSLGRLTQNFLTAGHEV